MDLITPPLYDSSATGGAGDDSEAATLVRVPQEFSTLRTAPAKSRKHFLVSPPTLKRGDWHASAHVTARVVILSDGALPDTSSKRRVRSWKAKVLAKAAAVEEDQVREWSLQGELWLMAAGDVLFLLDRGSLPSEGVLSYPFVPSTHGGVSTPQVALASPRGSIYARSTPALDEPYADPITELGRSRAGSSASSVASSRSSRSERQNVAPPDEQRRRPKRVGKRVGPSANSSRAHLPEPEQLPEIEKLSLGRKIAKLFKRNGRGGDPPHPSLDHRRRSSASIQLTRTKSGMSTTSSARARARPPSVLSRTLSREESTGDFVQQQRRRESVSGDVLSGEDALEQVLDTSMRSPFPSIQGSTVEAVVVPPSAIRYAFLREERSSVELGVAAPDEYARADGEEGFSREGIVVLEFDHARTFHERLQDVLGKKRK